MVGFVRRFYFCGRFGRSRSSKVILVGANRKRVCHFLLVRNSNLGLILHRFGDLTVLCVLTSPLFPLILGVFPLHQIAHVGRQRAHGP